MLVLCSVVDAFLRQHGPLVRRLALRHCPHHLGITPEEIEQEAQIRLWRAHEGERRIDDPASYVRRVVATVTVDLIRRTKARREDPLEDPAGPELDAPRALPADPSPSPEQLALDRQWGARLLACLERLAAPRQRAVRLHLLGCNSEEIAALSGWSEPKARNLAHRGLRDLRQLLERERDDA